MNLSLVARPPALFPPALLSVLMLISARADSPSVWNGGGANDNWSNAANWGGNAPIPGAAYDLQFWGATRPTPYNDFPDSSNFGGITFGVDAGAFVVSGNALTLHGDVANFSTNRQTLDNAVVATGARLFTTTAGGGDMELRGNISGDSGEITKLGAGTLTLAGANTYAGATTVNEGTVVITGSLTNAGGFLLNNGTVNISGAVSNGGHWALNGSAGGKAVVNVGAGAVIVKRGSLHLGTAADTSGALNITGGSFRSITNWSFNNFAIAGLGYGALTVSGGSVDSRGFIFGTSASGSGSLGMGTISGGTVTVDNHVVIPYYTGTAVLTVGTNGTLRRTSGTGNLNVNQKGNGRGELNVLGGIVDNGGGTIGFGTGSSPGTGGSGIVNLNAGSLTAARFNATANGSSRLNFNGGMLRAFTNRTDFVPATFSSVYVNGPFAGFSGGAVIDSAGFAVTIAANLVAPTGEGVSALTLADGGSGYIGAPYVSIVDSGGAGFGATAIADMVDDGAGNGTLKVGSIRITNPGVDYATATTSFLLIGGAPDVPAQPGAVTTAANTSGGLAKVGEGKVTLSGANTYTGGTIVSGGTLAVNNQTDSGTGPGTVTVKAGATLTGSGTVGGAVILESGSYLAPGDGIGTLSLGGNLTLSGGDTIVFEITDAASSDKLIVGGNLHPAGMTTISVPGSAPLADGDYLLMEVTGKLGGDPSKFSVSSPSPSKTYALVYLSGTPNKVVLRVGASSNLLTWTGGAGATWDVGATLNWRDAGATSRAFHDNDVVVFDDSGTANPFVNIAATVSPAYVSVNAAGDYAFGGVGHIAGAGTVQKAGLGALTLSNANTFNGGLTLSAGTLNLNHPSAPGSGKLTIAGGILDNTSGAAITLAHNNPQAWDGDFTFAGSSDLDLGTGDVTPSANRLVTVNNHNLIVGGGISGAFGLTKAGLGTLTLGGANTYSGNTLVTGGTLAIGGSLISSAGAITNDGGTITVSGAIDTGAGAWVVGASGTSVLSITPGAAIMKNGFLRIANSAGSSGAVNVTGGSFTNLLPWSFNNFSVGLLGYGALTVSGGHVDSRGFLLGCGNDPASVGIATISGGTVTVDHNVVAAYYTGTGVLTVSTNGRLLRTAGANTINLNHKGNGRGEFNLTGGTVHNGNGLVHFGTGPSATDGGSAILNLDAGTLTVAGFTNYQGNSRLNFNGGILRPSSNRTDFMQAAEKFSVCVNGAFGSFAGGAVIDTAGFDATIAADLLAPSGQGVNALTVADGGSGYIGAPYVAISDSSGTGFGATAVAEMADDGTGKGTLKVAGIRITNPGVDYTAGSTSFTLTGGAPTVAAVPGTVTLAASTSGGLTKLGEGTLTLSGANTYTGATVVNAGVLAVDGSLAAGSAVTVTGGSLGGGGFVGGPVTVQAGGMLSPGTSIGTLTLGGSLTLSNGSTTFMELNKSANTNDVVVVDAVTYGGRLAVTNVAGALAMGDAFKLFSAAAHSGSFSEIVVAGGTAVFDPASGVLTITGLVADHPTNVSFSYGGGQLSLSWPSSHKGWYVQSNAVDVADRNSWFDIPASAAVTSLDIAVQATSPQVFYRLRKP